MREMNARVPPPKRLLIVTDGDVEYQRRRLVTEPEWMVTQPGGMPLLGRRFEEILVDVKILSGKKHEEVRRIFEWIEEAVTCRLDPKVGRMQWR
jgi:hypothetical protein